jgi:dihydroxy-acid dehydratase
VRNGDRIRLSVSKRSLELAVPESELKSRKAAWKPPVGMPSRGYAKLYMEHVLQAEHGCDFDFLRKA